MSIRQASRDPIVGFEHYHGVRCQAHSSPGGKSLGGPPTDSLSDRETFAR